MTPPYIPPLRGQCTLNMETGEMHGNEHHAIIAWFNKNKVKIAELEAKVEEWERRELILRGALVAGLKVVKRGLENPIRDNCCELELQDVDQAIRKELPSHMDLGV